jgi:hypothetical protein
MAKAAEVREMVPVSSGQVEKAQGGQLPAHMMEDADQLAGLGNSRDANDASMPFLAILQKGSPQCDDEHSKHIDGAKAGMFLNTATGRLWDGKEAGVEVIPCGYQKKFVEWKPNRGGYVETHDFDPDLVKRELGAIRKTAMVDGKERTFIATSRGNILTETAYTFILVDGGPMVIGAASTALGPMRNWMSYRRTVRSPAGKELMSFAKRYQLHTVYETKDTNSWYNWKFRDIGYTLSETDYKLAREFAIAIEKGEVQVGRPDMFDEEVDEQRDPGSRGSRDDGIAV